MARKLKKNRGRTNRLYILRISSQIHENEKKKKKRKKKKKEKKKNQKSKKKVV